MAIETDENIVMFPLPRLTTDFKNCTVVKKNSFIKHAETIWSDTDLNESELHLTKSGSVPFVKNISDTCTYQRVTNVGFSENVAYVLNESTLKILLCVPLKS